MKKEYYIQLWEKDDWEQEGQLTLFPLKSAGLNPVMGRKLGSWSIRRKRWILGVGGIDPSCAGVNAISIPPGKYDRKIKTQRN